MDRVTAVVSSNEWDQVQSFFIGHTYLRKSKLKKSPENTWNASNIANAAGSVKSGGKNCYIIKTTQKQGCDLLYAKRQPNFFGEVNNLPT